MNECVELPQILLMENVTQVHNSRNIEDFQKWIDFLKSKGYSNYWKDLNAKDYGVAQNRNRCFMISILGDYFFEFPNPIKSCKIVKDYLEDNVEHKYFADTGKTSFLLNNFSSDYDKEVKNKPICLNSKGGRNGIKGLQPSVQDRVYSIYGLSTAITTSFMPYILDDREHIFSVIRKLTPKECWRLMGFSDEDFYRAREVNSNTQLYKQAGNSIVVNVLMAIFKNLF